MKVLGCVPHGASSTENVDAVTADLHACGALVERPGLSAAALVLAAGLDDPTAMTHHPALAHRLSVILDKLLKGTPQRDKLAAVQAMTPLRPGR